MRLFLKIFRSIAALTIVLTVILFISASLLQDSVAGIILRSLNNKLLTKYEFRTVRLSFLKNFPKASLDLKDVFVHSSPGFDIPCFEGINTDTLLSAKTVSMEFKLTNIIKGNYTIERIGIKDGHLNLFTDTEGLTNYEITAGNEKVSGDNLFTINLDRINLSDVEAVYNNRANKLLIKGLAESGHLKSRISGNDIDFSGKAVLLIDCFQLYNFSMARHVETDLDINLHSTGIGIIFDKSIIDIDDYNFELSGSISSENVLDLYLTGKNIDISGIKNYVPDKHINRISAYNPSGIMNIESKFTGPVTRTSNPRIDINFMLQNGSVTYGTSAVTLKDLSFKGFFTNGSEMLPETSSLIISDFEARLGSAGFSGSLDLSDFNSLHSTLNLKGQLYPAEIREFFNLSGISTATGVIDFDMQMAGAVPRKDKYSAFDFFGLNPEADLSFKSFGIGIKDDKILFSDVDGNFLVSNNAVADNMKFTWKDQQFEVNGKIRGFNDWMAGKPVIMAITADASCNRLNAGSFFIKPPGTDTVSIRNNKAFSLPDHLIMDLNFEIGNLLYKDFSADKIKGSASYSPGIITFDTLTCNSLNGRISGSGFIGQNTDKSFIVKGRFDLDRINVKNTFSTFNNFGQNFIKAENLNGNLSGSLSLLLPTDSLLKPEKKSITAEGKYTLSNGALVDFEPIKALSAFISLSELSNISFEELKNDFFIRNNNVYIPQMEVKSSAADLSINGKHDFDNNYEYHIKILLSEMLSKKVRKPKTNTTEFGAVKDDGLGRTSLLLKIANRGEEVNVSYDIVAVANQIRNDIKAERQTLKKILNEEYGWYPGDTSVIEKPAAGKTPRFKVIWEEIDTAKVRDPAPAVKKKDIF